ncbi:hypothetical protein Neosp_015194, partial [[Neocosmospora] mangrovei]
MTKAAYQVAASLDPKPPGWTLSYDPPYDEFNEPALPDWTTVFRFVLDLYYLVNVVNQFPDLKVSVDPIATDLDKAPMLLRHDLVYKETMLAFFSDQPPKTGLQGLRFELPPHQSYFSAATLITRQGCEMSYKKQFTMPDPNDPLDPSKPNRQRNQPIATLYWDRNGKGTRTDHNPDGKFRSPSFVWGTTETTNEIRLLLVEKITEDVYQTLKLEMNRLHPGWLTEP